MSKGSETEKWDEEIQQSSCDESDQVSLSGGTGEPISSTTTLNQHQDVEQSSPVAPPVATTGTLDSVQSANLGINFNAQPPNYGNNVQKQWNSNPNLQNILPLASGPTAPVGPMTEIFQNTLQNTLQNNAYGNTNVGNRFSVNCGPPAQLSTPNNATLSDLVHQLQQLLENIQLCLESQPQKRTPLVQPRESQDTAIENELTYRFGWTDRHTVKTLFVYQGTGRIDEISVEPPVPPSKLLYVGIDKLNIPGRGFDSRDRLQGYVIPRDNDFYPESRTFGNYDGTVGINAKNQSQADSRKGGGEAKHKTSKAKSAKENNSKQAEKKDEQQPKNPQPSEHQVPQAI